MKNKSEATYTYKIKPKPKTGNKILYKWMM